MTTQRCSAACSGWPSVHPISSRSPSWRPKTALRHALDQRPADVVIVDYDLARGDGLAVCQRLKQRSPSPRVVVYSAYAGSALAVAARAAGADGLVGKSDPVADLLASVRRVAQGDTLLPEIQHDAQQAAMSRLRRGRPRSRGDAAGQHDSRGDSRDAQRRTGRGGVACAQDRRPDASHRCAVHRPQCARHRSALI